MGKKVSIPYRLTASPGASGFINIYTVPAGMILTIKKIIVHFPSGTLGQLHLRLYYGHMKVYPQNDYISGDDVKFEDEVDITYWSADPVRLWYENVNTAEARYADIKLEAELV